MAALEQHHWPGNIRELQNILERGVILTTGSVLSRQTTDLFTPSEPAPTRIHAVAEPVNIKTLAAAERAHIVATLRETNWVVGGPHGAAAQLGLPRTTLIARMQRLGIASETPRGRSVRPFLNVIGGLSSHLRDDSEAGLQVVEAVAG